MALSSTDSAARTPEMPPIERAETIPARWHVDERFHAFDYFYDADATPKRIENDIAFSDKVQQENITICEHMQRGMESKAYDRGRFSMEIEEGVYHFQRRLKCAYRQATTA